MTWYCSSCLYEKENCYCKHGSFVEIDSSIEISIDKRKQYIQNHWDELPNKEKPKKLYPKD